MKLIGATDATSLDVSLLRNVVWIDWSARRMAAYRVADDYYQQHGHRFGHALRQ